jgi:hypothetical protein
MSLTVGSGPFGQRPAGSFSFEVPSDEVVYLEASPRWIRGRLGGQTVVDSRRVRMLHESGRLPVCALRTNSARDLVGVMRACSGGRKVGVWTRV